VPFTLLPAVDVAGGRAVRPHGDGAGAGAGAGAAAIPGDPLELAQAWQGDGAAWIHLVDLDAAYGRGSNAGLLAALVGALDVKVQLSGGIRDDRSLERALATGCARVNLSTTALHDLDWCERVIAMHGERIAVALDVLVIAGADDAREHRVAARGGTGHGQDLWDTLARLDRAGCARYVVTDVSKDGMLRGPNLELYRLMAGATVAPVIASGGISAVHDLVALAAVAEGAVVGTALSAGRFTLPEALDAVRGAGGSTPT
jgi:phosphoribosyl isomerase A